MSEQTSGHRLVFSSPAAGQTEARRLAQWWDAYRASLGGVDISVDTNLPLATSVKVQRLGELSVGWSTGSIDRFERRAEHAVRDGHDGFHLVINCGQAASRGRTASGDACFDPGAAMLFDLTEPGINICPGGHTVIALMLPRPLLRGAMPGVEDANGTVIPASNEALRLLIASVNALLNGSDVSDEAVLARTGQYFADLVALGLGTDRDNADVARLRGLRASRLAAVLRHIRAHFVDAALSPDSVAGAVGISARYLHELLQESGTSFAERVLDLRLARAFALLRGADGPARKVSDIAYAAGFNDLSHFNRCFRRRYGLTPTAARAAGSDARL